MVLYKFCVDCVPTTVGLLIVAVPVVAPILIAVAAPKALTVVAVESIRLNVEAVVVMSPPLTPKSPDRVKSAAESPPVVLKLFA